MPPKPDAKPAPPATDPFVEIVFFIIGCFALVYIVNAVLAVFSRLFGNGLSFSNVLSQIENFVAGNSPTIWIIRIILTALSVVCVAVLVDLIFKLTAFRKEQYKLLYPDIPVSAAAVNPEWQQILDQIESANENDWRQAIISADIMLDRLVTSMNLPGDTLGDKLKAVVPGDFLTLNNAWEAHKIRNQIAHEGPAFILTARTAKARAW